METTDFKLVPSVVDMNIEQTIGLRIDFVFPLSRLASIFEYCKQEQKTDLLKKSGGNNNESSATFIIVSRHIYSHRGDHLNGFS